MKDMRWWLASLAVAPALLVAPSAKALSVTVSPAGPAGQSLWTFSGSATYSQMNPGGTFAGGALSLIQEWKGDGGSDDVKTSTYNHHVAALISGSIGITVTPLTGSAVVGQIDGLHSDHDNSGDDFGVSLLDADIPLADGDIVSWSGSGIFPVDMSNLNVGIFQFVAYGEVPSGQPNAGNPYGSLPLSLTVSPAPGPLPILGCGAAFSFARKLRRTCNNRRLITAP